MESTFSVSCDDQAVAQSSSTRSTPEVAMTFLLVSRTPLYERAHASRRGEQPARAYASDCSSTMLETLTSCKGHEAASNRGADWSAPTDTTSSPSSLESWARRPRPCRRVAPK